MKKINLVGKQFGELKVIKEAFSKNRTSWECLCSCGNTIVVLSTNLITRNTTSCHGKGKLLIKHGKFKHPCYNSWRSMIQRCENKNSSDYKNYGKLGITVCKSWRNIENFINDMGLPPSKSHTIDRIDNSKGYNKQNCRWATKTEQAQNRKNSIYLEDLPLKEWAIKNNIPYNVALSRYKKGWCITDIKNTPVINRYVKGQLCSIKGCNNPVKTRDMCNKHYLRWWNVNKHKFNKGEV